MTIGIILAGGQSSRFEYGDKALFFDQKIEKYWLELAYEKLSALTEQTYIIANSSNFNKIKTILPDAPVLQDHPNFSGEGPLAGLFTVSNLLTEPSVSVQAFDYLILSVDAPELSTKSLAKLLSVRNQYVKDNFTIAHLYFSHSQIQTFLQNHQRRMKDFLSLLNATPLVLPESELINHNFH